jgi:hypothetical protein
MDLFHPLGETWNSARLTRNTTVSDQLGTITGNRERGTAQPRYYLGWHIPIPGKGEPLWCKKSIHLNSKATCPN